MAIWRWWPGTPSWIHGGGFGPGGEGVLAGRHGPPHAARAAEVVGGARVVDAAFVGGRDPAFQRFHDVRDLEVDAGEFRDGFVGEFLHPGLEGVGALELAGGIVVQDLLGFLHRGAGPDFAGHAFLFGDEAVEFLDAPGVGLLQVHGGAEEVPGGQGVAARGPRRPWPGRRAAVRTRGNRRAGSRPPGQLPRRRRAWTAVPPGAGRPRSWRRRRASRRSRRPRRAWWPARSRSRPGGPRPPCRPASPTAATRCSRRSRRGHCGPGPRCAPTARRCPSA